MQMTVRSILHAFGRKKVDEEFEVKTRLARVLNLLDLTALGVGSTLGLGVYVLAGSVAKNQAGPAVVLSFLVAAVASAFAAVCYAEFASRVPKAGSAYIYSYVSIGELTAFIIGWNLILEYVIGTASVARGLSNYIDSLAKGRIAKALTDAMPIDILFLSPFPDFLSFILVMTLASLLAFGVKESSLFNNIFVGLNLIIIATVIISGSTVASFDNWTIPKDVAQAHNAGDGGFMPYGIAGVMTGAAKCFFGFVGFDGVATTGEEAKNPQKNIPLAILCSLIIVFCAYFGIATVLTLMWPYYDQDADAPFPYVFDKVHLDVVYWVVTIGAIIALFTSLLGAMFPLPRVLYAMGTDGVIFRFFSTVNSYTKTPIIATYIGGLLAGLMAMLFNLDQLVDMMSIGTLLAYTIVAICVMVLRYEEPQATKAPMATIDYGDGSFSSKVRYWLRLSLNLAKQDIISEETSMITKWAIITFCLFGIGFCAILVFAPSNIGDGDGWAVTLFVILGLILIWSLVVMSLQPSTTLQLTFKSPLVPWLPGISIIVNTYLMLQLDSETWIRFGIWMIMGFAIYFGYGVTHSSAAAPKISLSELEPTKEERLSTKSETQP